MGTIACGRKTRHVEWASATFEEVVVYVVIAAVSRWPHVWGS